MMISICKLKNTRNALNACVETGNELKKPVSQIHENAG